MPRNYHHLSHAERETIMRLRDRRVSVGKIAAELGRHPATIYRELRRNFFYDDDAYFRGYFGRVAHSKAAARRVRGGKVIRNERLASRIAECLVGCWSPEQIAGRLRLDQADPIVVCHETIYQFVYGPEVASLAYGTICHVSAKRGASAMRASHAASISRSPTPLLSGQRRLLIATSLVIGKAISLLSDKNLENPT